MQNTLSEKCQARLPLRTVNTRVEDPITYSRGIISAGDYVALQLIDNGPGISEDIIDKIFVPGFTTKGKKGTGLGLANVLSFVQESEGHITVQSTVGDGAMFSIYFRRVAVRD